MAIPTAPTQPATVEARERPRVPFRTRFGYSLGEVGFGLSFLGVISFLPLFYTDGVGIGAGVAGLLIVIARICDGIFDLAVGLLAERTRSAMGRFRPWIFYGAIPLVVFCVLAFTAPFGGDTTAAVVWAAITYTLAGFAFSAVNIPFGAISAVMAETPADRTSINGQRFVMQNVSLIIAGALTLPLVGAFGAMTGNGPISSTGFSLTLLVFGLISLPIFYITFRSSKETVAPVRTERPTVGATISALAANPPLIFLALLVLLAGTAFYGRLGVIVYYYIYNAQSLDLTSLLIPLTPVGSMVGVLIFMRFARTLGKRNLFLLGQAVQVLALVVLFFTDPGNITLLIVVTVIHGMAGVTIPLLPAMLADAIDFGEQKTGVRTDGTAFAVITLSAKIATVVSGAGVALLALFGYVPGVQQTPEALDGINLVANIIPAGVGVAAIIVALLYRLSDKDAARIRSELNADMAAQKPSA